MKYAVAIDIGGTNTRVALIDEKLNIVSREQFSTDNKEPEITLNKISDIVKAFDKDITGIGMSCPGPLDLMNGKVLTPPNLNGKWHNLEISKVLSEKTGKPVYWDNDANLAGLAEAVIGEGKDCNIVQYLTVSTGLGAGLEVNHAGEVNDLAMEGNKEASEIMKDAKNYLANFIALIYGFADPDIVILGGSVALKIDGFVEEVEALVKEKVYEVMKPYVKVRKSTLNEDSGLIGAGYLAFSKEK